MNAPLPSTEIPTRRQLQILRHLRRHRARGWITEAELRVSFRVMQEMYFRSWTDGAGRRDDKGTGNYPHTRVAKITADGLRVLEAYEAAHPIRRATEIAS